MWIRRMIHEVLGQYDWRKCYADPECECEFSSGFGTGSWSFQKISFLSNSLSSGEMILVFGSLSPGLRFEDEGRPVLTPEAEADERSGDLPLFAFEGDWGWGWMGLRCWADGVGKLSFLSIASTERPKRWKRDSARARIGRRSMVLESSLTGWLRMLANCVCVQVETRGMKLTVFQDLIELFEMVHYDVSVFL